MPWSLTEAPADVVSIFTSFIPGFRLIDGGDLEDMAKLLLSARSGIMGGTDQQNATQLKTFISEVASGTTAVLPPGLPGRYMWVFNNTAATLQVYGASPNPQTGLADEIDGQIMYPQPAGSAVEYVCFATGMWQTMAGADGVGPGPGGGIPDAPFNGITYGRQNGEWVPVLPLSGGTMTGPLILAPGPPTDPNQAVSLTDLQNLHIDEGTY